MARKAPVPIAEFRVADANAVWRGVPLAALMENAGRAVAREVARHVAGPHPRALVLCGKGNNGGDGYVAAHELSGRFRATVVFAEGRSAVDASSVSAGPLQRVEADRAIEKLDWSAKGRRDVERAAREADVVLDCLLGSGISGPARPPYDGLIALVNRVDTLTVSVDVPSGFPFQPAVRPDFTLTIEAPKVGMTRRNAGTVVPLAIGFPRQAWTHTGPGELLLIPKVPDAAQKRDRGVLAVVAGGPYSGAPALVGLAAHACGVGLVHLFVPQNVADVVRRFDPTLVVHPLEGDELGRGHVRALLRAFGERQCGALAIGPGLGRAAQTQEAVRHLLRDVRLPTVVDADAIQAAAPLGAGAPRRALFTPHAGEFRALAGAPPPDESSMALRAAAAKRAARRRRATVLLKGHVSVVTDGLRVKFNDAGVSAMAVGGTGDVLTGIIGAFLAKGLEPFDAARAGAFLAGRAGELAFEDLGHSLKPTDLLAAIPRVLSRHVPWWGGKP